MNKRIANKLANFQAKLNPIQPEPRPKSDVRHNAYRHGLTAQALLLSDEERLVYNAMAADFRQRFQPADGYEQQLLQKVIDTNWRLNICASIESAIYAPPAFDRWERPDDTPEEKYLKARARAFKENDNAFSLLARYEGGLARRFHAMLRELESAIAKREYQEKAKRKADQQAQPAPATLGSSNDKLKELVMSAAASSQPPQNAPLPSNPNPFRQTSVGAPTTSALASATAPLNNMRKTKEDVQSRA